MSLEEDYQKLLVEKKKLWANIKLELNTAPEIYHWQAQVDSAGSGKFGRYFQNGMAIIMIILALFFGWLAVRGDNWVGFWVVASAGILMTCFVRFLWMADNLYQYKLTDKGILYTQQQVIPEVTYSIVRGTAWVGIGVCVLAAALVGPLAFVGGGVFALMSFSMTKFSPTVSTHWVYFQGSYEFAHLKDEGLIELASDCAEPSYIGTIYCDLDEKYNLLELLQSVLPGSPVFEMTRFRDIRDFIHSSRKTKSSDSSQ